MQLHLTVNLVDVFMNSKRLRYRDLVAYSSPVKVYIIESDLPVRVIVHLHVKVNIKPSVDDI